MNKIKLDTDTHKLFFFVLKKKIIMVVNVEKYNLKLFVLKNSSIMMI
jgi:hypothetical protein